MKSVFTEGVQTTGSHVSVLADRSNRLQSVGGKTAIKVVFTSASHRFDLFFFPVFMTNQKVAARESREHKMNLNLRCSHQEAA